MIVKPNFPVNGTWAIEVSKQELYLLICALGTHAKAPYSDESETQEKARAMNFAKQLNEAM